MFKEIPHIPVLLDEVQATFSAIEGVVVDCTLGFGSHTYTLLESNPKLKVIGIDQDAHALEYATKRLAPFRERFVARLGRFSQVCKDILKEQEVVGILADIGISSYQLDCKERGFSFDSPFLDMRMDATQLLSAKEVINGYSKVALEQVFKEYGEIREHKKLAHLITERRKKKSFETSRELADFVSGCVVAKKSIHPATLVFQAIRMEVNQELQELKTLLEITKNKTRVLSIISFHSLEDRLVKNAFKEFAQDCICPKESFRCECGGGHALGYTSTKKPIIPQPKEIKKNHRSRSAKMRVFHFSHPLGF